MTASVDNMRDPRIYNVIGSSKNTCKMIDSSRHLSDHAAYQLDKAGLENSTHSLVLTSASGCRASENFDISSIN